MPQQPSPQLPPLIFQRSGKYTYVTTYKNFWDAKLKKARRCTGSTKTVGKLIGGGSEGEILWTDDFLKDHAELKKFSAVRKKLTNREGKSQYKIEFSLIEQTYPISILLESKRLEAGATWVLDNIIANTPLVKALNTVFNKYNTNKKIISFAYYLLLNQNNSMYLYEDFSQKTRLPYQKVIYSHQISRIFKNITTNQIDKFFIELNNEYKKEEDKIKNKDNKDNIEYLALDSTSISTYSNNLKNSAYGHNKDGDDLKQINVLMLVNQKTGQPLYFREYPGNTPDISTISFMLKEYARIGIDQKFILVTDRGYSSIPNIGRCLQSKISFVMNLKKYLKLCKQLVAENLWKLTDYCSYSTKIGCSCICIPVEWQYPTTDRDSNGNAIKSKETIFIHIYLDINIKNNDEEKIREKISKIHEKIINNKELTQEEIDIKNKFLKKDENDVYSVDAKARIEYMLMKGIRILISDVISDSIDCWIAYYERERVEEAFSFLKQKTGGSRARTYTNETTEGKLFVHFISCAIGIMFRKRISNIKIDDKSIPYDSDLKILKKLNTIEQTIFNAGSYYNEIVGFNRKLLEALNIPFPEAELNNENDEKEEDIESKEEKYFNDKDDLEQIIDN